MEKDRKRRVHARFLELYGTLPNVWVQAPGRVDLMGSHTDYNEGFVLTQAIDRNTWIAARPREDGRVRIASFNASGDTEFPLTSIEYDKQLPWTNYVRGVAWALLEQGYQLSGFDGLVQSTVPFGSGLSSSAALEVAVAVLFDRLGQLDMDRVEMALLCQRAENEFVGLNCGILDQYSSVMGEDGRAILLDCRELNSRSVSFAAGLELVICDTRAERQLTESEYSERRTQCEQGVSILADHYPNIRALRDVNLMQLREMKDELPDVIGRRCRFVVEENARVMDMADALDRSDQIQIGKLTAASYDGARSLYEVVSLEMEQMMSAMITGPGIIGGRQAGAGFGGCLVAFVRSGTVDDFCEHVRRRYYIESGIQPEVYPVRAAAGAGLLLTDARPDPHPSESDRTHPY